MSVTVLAGRAGAEAHVCALELLDGTSCEIAEVAGGVFCIKKALVDEEELELAYVFSGHSFLEGAV